MRRRDFWYPMPKTDRLTEHCNWIDLGLVEREATPRGVMKLGISLRLAGLSLADTVSILERFGVERHRSIVVSNTRIARHDFLALR